MTNGIFEITDSKGKVTTLMIGFNAAMEFEKRYFSHYAAKNTPNEAVMTTDLVFSGMQNQAMKHGKVLPKYQEAFDLVEDISQMDNFKDVVTLLFATYYETKWGTDFEKRCLEIKKKMEEQLESLN